MYRLLLLFLLASHTLFGATENSSEDSLSQRKTLLLLGGGLGYTAGMAGLYHAWYREQNSGSFYFFNDNAEWKQMDKFGHSYTAFHLSHALYHGLTWSGYSEKSALRAASITSFAMMLPIEIFDGFSEAYGFSWGDVLANGIGSGLFFAQMHYWNDIRINPKFSFSRSQYAPLRPSLLGNGWQEEWLKDYNGQTYWFSFHPLGLTGAKPPLPWLNLSLGYSAYNMIFARDAQNIAAGLQPGRQFLLSLDIDFRKIPTEKLWLRKVFYMINHLKVPAPSLEWRPGQGIRGHGLYF